MPRADGFRDLLQHLGGTWKEDAPGDFVVFRRFVAPYDETRPVPEEAVWVGTLDGAPVSAGVLDRDASTEWRSPLGIARHGRRRPRHRAAPALGARSRH